jgi:hypothetical protein
MTARFQSRAGAARRALQPPRPARAGARLALGRAADAAAHVAAALLSHAAPDDAAGALHSEQRSATGPRAAGWAAAGAAPGMGRRRGTARARGGSLVVVGLPHAELALGHGGDLGGGLGHGGLGHDGGLHGDGHLGELRAYGRGRGGGSLAARWRARVPADRSVAAAAPRAPPPCRPAAASRGAARARRQRGRAGGARRGGGRPAAGPPRPPRRGPAGRRARGWAQRQCDAAGLLGRLRPPGSAPDWLGGVEGGLGRWRAAGARRVK